METTATFRKAMAQIMKGRMAFHGVKQAETAEAIGISQSQLSKILRADRPIDLETFEAFCTFLGDDAASLVAQGQALADARKDDQAKSASAVDDSDVALASADVDTTPADDANAALADADNGIDIDAWADRIKAEDSVREEE